MDEIIDISRWAIVERWSTTGSRNKIWIWDPSLEATGFFLFKESYARYPWEFWTEIIAYEFGSLVGVDVPRTRCAQRSGVYGALVDYIPKMDVEREGKSMTATLREQMFDGGEWILKLDSSFDRKKGAKHNIWQIQQIFSPEEFRQFVRMLIFDALIGNTDRHQDNWALLTPLMQSGQPVITSRRLAPAYDNASSLGTNLMENALARYINSDSDLGTFILKGTQHLRWSDDGKNLMQLNHFDFLQRLSQKHDCVAAGVAELSSFSEEKFNKILTSLKDTAIADEKYRLTPTRTEFILQYVLKRCRILRTVFGLKS